MRAIPAKIADNSAVHMPLFALPSDFGILKKFLTHLSWLMVLNLTIKPAYLLVVDAKIQDALGPEAWGNFFPLLSLSILLNILLDAGLANHTTRAIAQNLEGLNGHFQSGWRAKGMLFPIYLLACSRPVTCSATGAPPCNGWDGWASTRPCSVPCSTFAQGFKAQANTEPTHGYPLPTEPCWWDWARCFLRVMRFNWNGYLVGQLRPSPQPAAGISEDSKTAQGVARSVDGFSNIWAHFKSSWPYALLFLLMMTYHRVDAIMLERWRRTARSKPGGMPWVPALRSSQHDWLSVRYPPASLLHPHVERWRRRSSAGRWSQRLLLVGGGSVARVAAFFAPAFLGLFYASFLNEAAPILPWLMASFAVFAQGYVYSTLLTARGDLKLLNRLAALAPSPT